MALSAKRKAQLDEMVKDWTTFVRKLKTFSEEDCDYLLKQEMRSTKRESFVVRLFGRRNRFRRRRELQILREQINPDLFKPKSRAAKSAGA